jgi:hypothetical protein
VQAFQPYKPISYYGSHSSLEARNCRTFLKQGKSKIPRVAIEYPKIFSDDNLLGKVILLKEFLLQTQFFSGKRKR